MNVMEEEKTGDIYTYASNEEEQSEFGNESKHIDGELQQQQNSTLRKAKMNLLNLETRLPGEVIIIFFTIIFGKNPKRKGFLKIIAFSTLLIYLAM